MTRRLLSIGFIACLALPAAAQNRGDFRWEKALAAGNEVSIHNINGDIKVTPSTTGRVTVVGTKRGNNRYFDRIKAEVQETSHGIVVCVVQEDADSYCDDRGVHMHGDHDWNNVSMDLEVTIPTNVTVSAGSVSGNVDITGANGDVEAGSVSGDIRLTRLRASSVSAHTVSGNVDVRVDAFTGRGDLSFKSVSGDVTLEVPRGFDADISMSTVSGDMNSDFPVTLGNGRMSHRRIEARVGSGGRRLDVSTVSGSLNLKMAR
ncbi:MAG TPA: DUF4097 family beta strand repeat-containing protein [Gemmatimonadaceae bacterium]|jgi:DUF4097 and DUF4098 domain-containing protein YvlB|nr:DUF4097 family beta strand repeat-containing protein [Gemmatimonadaceae bacterium]